MSITITGDSAFQTEQIKKIPDTTKVFESVRLILENDEYNFFNTKTKYKLKKEISQTEATISKLIELRVAAVSEGKKLKKQYKQIIEKNDELKSKIISELE